MQNQVRPRRPLNELLRAIDTCPTIDKLFEIVKNEHIVVRMQSQNAASNIPMKQLAPTTTPPLDRLRAQVREAAIAMYDNEDHTVDRLLYQIDTCPTIDELFRIVKDEHIVIRMKSQNAASNIPFQPLPKDTTPPLERLREQVRDAVIAKYDEDRSMQRLMYKIDTCPTIDKLFQLVKDEHIVIQMKSQNAASNIPFQPLPKDTTPPLERLREQVREAAATMFRNRSKQKLIRAIETCPSIDKLFALVKNEHIVIRMKSQHSASNLPQRKLSGDELMPDTTPLERLRQQVLEAVIYGD